MALELPITGLAPESTIPPKNTKTTQVQVYIYTLSLPLIHPPVGLAVRVQYKPEAQTFVSLSSSLGLAAEI